MLTVAEALAAILAEAWAGATVQVPLAASLNRVLAEDVASDIDSPPHDRATVDGYAIIAADLAAPGNDIAVADFTVIEEITAGQIARYPITRGQTSRVMTGAPIPPGADAMVMIERSVPIVATADDAEQVRLTQTKVRVGQNIVRRASSIARGDVVLGRGHRLRPAEIGLLAEVGRGAVLIHRPPSLAIISTGNELVDPACVPRSGQIRDSNGPLLAAAGVRLGAEVLSVTTARDDPAELATRIAQGLAADVLLISGGVSVGKLDLVPAALATAGVRQVFHKINLKPGKPLWFGVKQHESRQTLVFGLPGNPVSALVCFELFVRPALAKLMGSAVITRPRLAARMAGDFRHVSDRPTYYPGRWQFDTSDAVAGELDRPTMPTVAPLTWHGSGDLRALTQASVLIYFPAGERNYAAGDLVEVLPFDE
jgi:molybdopterin molybdotransferase